jgi:ribosomal-protein-serine acetyltransferase
MPEAAAIFRFELPGGCYVRPFEESDADELDRVISENRAYLAEWLPWAEESGGVDARLEFIRRGLQQIAANDGFQAAIIDGGQIVGAIGFHGVDWEHRSTSIGYWLAEDRQGRGTITEAVRALTSHAFEGWRLNRVEIRVAVGNRRSAAIPERLGFAKEGILRQAERHGDTFKDLVVYSMLAENWRGNEPGSPSG